MLKVLRQETLKLLPMDTALQRSDEALKAMEASMGTHQVTMQECSTLTYASGRYKWVVPKASKFMGVHSRYTYYIILHSRYKFKHEQTINICKPYAAKMSKHILQPLISRLISDIFSWVYEGCVWIPKVWADHGFDSGETAVFCMLNAFILKWHLANNCKYLVIRTCLYLFYQSIAYILVYRDLPKGYVPTPTGCSLWASLLHFFEPQPSARRLLVDQLVRCHCWMVTRWKMGKPFEVEKDQKKMKFNQLPTFAYEFQVP